MLNASRRWAALDNVPFFKIAALFKITAYSAFPQMHSDYKCLIYDVAVQEVFRLLMLVKWSDVCEVS